MSDDFEIRPENPSAAGPGKESGNDIVFALRGEFIKLDQLLKASGLASTGGQARMLIEERQVRVDGVIETRKGRKLRPGSRVEISDAVIRLE